MDRECSLFTIQGIHSQWKEILPYIFFFSLKRHLIIDLNQEKLFKLRSSVTHFKFYC